MKTLLNFLLISLVMGYFVSCVSLQDRALSATDKNETEIIGSVKTEFVSIQVFNIINKERISGEAYKRLMELAKSQYGNNVDIRNIKISGGFSGFEVLYLAAGPVGFNTGSLISNFIFASTHGYKVGIGDIYRNHTNLLIGGSLLSIPLTALIVNSQKITATGDVISTRYHN